MTKYWKVALAVGGLALLWIMSRGEEDHEHGKSSGNRSDSGSSGGGSGAGATPGPAPSPPGQTGSGAGASAGAGAGAGSAESEDDGGVVRDGRMRGGTWNFAPSDAPGDAQGYLVLRDVPKSAITIDGRAVELRGGFRGFREVPPGKHRLELEGYGGTKVVKEIEMPPGGCIVLIYEDTGGPPRLEPDRDWGPQYIGLAMGGAMGQALWSWPEE